MNIYYQYLEEWSILNILSILRELAGAWVEAWPGLASIDSILRETHWAGGADEPLLRLKITQNHRKTLKIAQKSAYRGDRRSM